ncbi:MAG: homocysteine S-methyltransferase family protein [Eubacteriales bacterium]|nr:homocysteine S-methyltransferase family protein [Eubacteriales bacterium]
MKNEQWNRLFGNELARFDGGMGTLLQAMGLKGGERPERWNLEQPEKVLDVHRRYLDAGAQVITANTFGATRSHLGDDASACMQAGVKLAKQAVNEAGRGYAAIDMGSLGRLPEPYGDLPLEDAIHQFCQAFAAGIDAGGDLILIETMTDLLEVKACVLGAKEAMKILHVSLPLLVSLTFDQRGRLLSGADLPGTVAMLCGLGVDAIGLNCGHEPKGIAQNVKALLACCPLPVFVSPNASLPVVQNGVTVYPTTPSEFTADMAAFVRLGVWGVGGCCGTTPEHIRLLTEATKGMQPIERRVERECVVSGRSVSVTLGKRPVLIGERLNPTGKKRMKEALRANDLDYLLREAIAQTDAGADILDLNVGLPELDEPKTLKAACQAVQTVCDLPLQLDTGDPAALEAALRCYCGKPLINSVCGKQSVMDAVFPLAAKYGGALVALTLDEDGIPETTEGRLAIAQKIITEAEKYGIPKTELLFDALTMTVATNENAANVTLRTARALHEELGVKTVLGVSNVSFGLPQRPVLTASLLAMAIHEGLDAAIMNPGDTLCKSIFDGATAIAGRDPGFARYLEGYGNAAPQMTMTAKVPVFTMGKQSPEALAALDALTSQRKDPNKADDPLYTAIVRGVCGDAATTAQARLNAGEEPLKVIEQSMMPALSAVGEKYEKGTLFLPQLLQSAAAAQAAFDLIRARLPEKAADDPAKKVVVATVKGDVHDIGKNIVKVLLQNYGFTVIDLGRDVAPDAVLAAVREHRAPMTGLSALMTTTVPAMEETIALLHREAPGVKIVVGGAVLNEEYAKQIKADAYGKDAMATVRVCQGWCRS